MATKEEVEQILKAFTKKYDSDGFLCFDDGCQISFFGNILVNYKGLRLIRFNKSKLTQFDQGQFQKICHKVCISPEKREQLFHSLKDLFKNSLLCVIVGDNFKTSGELAAYSKDNLGAFLF